MDPNGDSKRGLDKAFEKGDVKCQSFQLNTTFDIPMRYAHASRPRLTPS